MWHDIKEGSAGVSTEAWSKESVGGNSVLCQEVKGLQEAPIPAVAVSMLKCLKDVRDWMGRWHVGGN